MRRWLVWVLCLLAGVASAARRPSMGGFVVIGVDEPLVTCDPARAFTLADWQAIALVHRGLFRFDDAGVPRPSLVAVESQDAGKLVVRLRAASFHDGHLLTTNEVIRSLQKGAPEVRVRQLDAARLELRAEGTPADRLAMTLAGVPITRTGAPEVGLGPFRVASRRRGRLELQRHTADLDGVPWLEGITLVEGAPADADVVLGASDPRPLMVRLDAVVAESAGLLVRPGVRRPAAAARAFPTDALARRLAGLVPTERLVPGDASLYLGVPEWYFAAVRTALAASPWPLEPLDRVRLEGLDARTLAEPEAVFVVLPPALVPRRVAERGGWEWYPLATRRRPILVAARIVGAWLTPLGTLDLGDAFLSASR